MGLAVFEGRAPVFLYKHFLAADATNDVDLGYAPLPHMLISALTLVNEDTIAHVVRVKVKTGATYMLVGSVSVPAGAGLAGAASVDLIAALPLTSLGGLLIVYNMQLSLALEVAMVGAHWLDAVAHGVVF